MSKEKIKTKAREKDREEDGLAVAGEGGLQDYVNSLLTNEVCGRIKKVNGHFYCEFGCKDFIFHTAEEIGEKVKELVKKYFK